MTPARTYLRAALLLAGALGTTFTSAPALAKDPYSIAPVPSWIEPVDPPHVDVEQDGGSRAGMKFALVDDQVRVGPKGTEHYLHRAQVVLSSAGVESGSEISVDFDPTYERLVFHRIVVHRDGAQRDALDPKTIRTFFQESEVERRIYDGAMTALAVLRDVRAGDVVEYDYSIVGQNPVLGGKFAGAFALSRWLDVEDLRVRLLVPTSHDVVMSAEGVGIEPLSREENGYRELLWKRQHVPAIESEGDTPASFPLVPRVVISEFASWKDVAEWSSSLMAPLYAEDAEVQRKADELRRASAAPEAQALAAVRFVQDEIRYLGIEMGESSHRPHAPREVLAKRFGDCKDKALLLAMLLRALGFTAHVALVHASAGQHLDTSQPSPYAFNHAIVALELGGATHWIDATIRDQGGSLSKLFVPSYGYALVVAPTTTALTLVTPPADDEPTVAVREVYRAEPSGPAARFEVETTFRGGDADSMRSSLAEASRAELRKKWINEYAKAEPTIVADGDPELSDDRAENRIVLRERYQIPDYIREGQACFLARSLGAPLHKPRTSLRSTPLHVAFPFFGRHEVELHLPRIEAIPEEMRKTSDALSFSRRVFETKDLVRVSFELRTLRDVVAPNEVAAHVRLLEAIGEGLGACAAVGGTVPANAELVMPRWVPWGAGGLIVVVAGVFGAVALPRRLRTRRWRKQQARERGDSPAGAIEVASREAATRDLVRKKCSCGLLLNAPDGESAWGGIRLGDRIITSAASRCSCGVVTKRYYVIGGG